MEVISNSMNRFRVRVSSLFALAAAFAAAFFGAPAPAQQSAPALWFQGTRLILEHPVPMNGDLAVSLADPGVRKFLDRLGATVSFDPQQRYVVVTAADRRTIAFTLGNPSYSAGGVRAQAPFAPFADAGSPVLPFFALARALYVEPVAGNGETVLQPRVGALDVRSEGSHTVITVRAAMPLVTTTQADTPDHLQIAFAGLGSALAPSRAPGPSVAAIDIAAGGSARVPVTTMTITGVRGATHRIVPTGSPDVYQVVFDAGPEATPTDSPFYPTVTPAPAAEPPTVTDVALIPSAGALIARVDLSGPAVYAWHRLADHRWYLDLADTTLSLPDRSLVPPPGVVQSVRVAQIGGPQVRIAFTLAGEQRVEVTPSTTGLTIAVYNDESTDVARSGSGRTGNPGVVAAAPADAPAQSALPQNDVTPSPAETPWKFASGSHTIVIDPGHGGGDTGAMHNGLVEKNLTMAISQRLRTLLVAQGWTVRMTHDTDIDPVSQANLAKMHADGLPNPDDRAYLQTRCDTANDINARLFISIHINPAPVTRARGTTFYWYKPQDAAFAQALERAVIPAAGTQDDGTRHENFYVVRHTTMPAVLIETAFLTNPGDVELLRNPAFLDHVAQGIAAGVRAYVNSPSANAVSAQ